LKLPPFVAALEAAREQQTQEAMDLLRGTLLAALTKLRTLLDSENPAVALKAASLLLEHALEERARRDSTLTVKQALDMQELFLTAVIDSLSELNIDTNELRSRVQQRLDALRQAGWPMTAALAGNSHAAHP